MTAMDQINEGDIYGIQKVIKKMFMILILKQNKKLGCAYVNV